MSRAVGIAAIVSLALVLVYLAAGGGDYEPTALADPCTREVRETDEGLVGSAERVGLVALDGAACELRVSREELLLAIAGEDDIPVDDDRRNEAFRAGLRKAIDQEEQAGRLSPTQATLFRAGLEFIPVEALIDRLFGR